MSLDYGDLSLNQQNESPAGEQIATQTALRARRACVCAAATGASARLRAEDRSLFALRADGDDADEQLFRLLASARNAMVLPYL